MRETNADKQMKKNQKNNKCGNHLHINETPFHVDVLYHPAERYITDKGADPKQIPVEHQKRHQ